MKGGVKHCDVDHSGPGCQQACCYPDSRVQSKDKFTMMMLNVAVLRMLCGVTGVRRLLKLVLRLQLLCLQGSL